MNNCPKCGEEALAGAEGPGGVAVDQCPRCRGVWLDGGELPRLKELTDSAAPKDRGTKPAPGRGPDPSRGAGMGAPGLRAGFTRAALPEDELTSLLRGKVIPLAAALFGFGGCLYQIYGYLNNSLDKVPFRTAPGLAGIAQSLGWFFAVTAGCIALFLFGLYMLLRDVSNISGDK